MSGAFEQATVHPGMPVYGIDGLRLGEVEAVRGHSICVKGHTIPEAAIDYVDQDAVHLQLARSALLAQPDPDLAPIDRGAE